MCHCWVGTEIREKCFMFSQGEARRSSLLSFRMSRKNFLKGVESLSLQRENVSGVRYVVMEMVY